MPRRDLERLRAGIHRGFAGADPVPGWGIPPVQPGERYRVTGDSEHPWLEGRVGEVVSRPVGMGLVRLRFLDLLVPGPNAGDALVPAEYDVPWVKLSPAG